MLVTERDLVRVDYNNSNASLRLDVTSAAIFCKRLWMIAKNRNRPL